MANLYSSDNFENMSFDPFQRNSVLLDNLSDPYFNFFNNNNLEAVNTKYFSLDELESHLSTAEDDNFSLLHINIRSMSKNFEKLKSLLLNMNFEFKIICLTETWCKSDDDKNNSLFQIPNYSLIHQARQDEKKGGGVCIFIQKSLNYKLRNDLNVNTSDNESLAVEIINK